MNTPRYTVKPRGHELPARVINKRGETVAEVYTDAEPGDQLRTAQVFATAHELLAALQAYANAFTRGDGDCTPAQLSAKRAGRAALAKATGVAS